MDISEKDLAKFDGEYVEVRHSSRVHHELKTQCGDDIQKKTEEGISLRIIDDGKLTYSYSSDISSLIEKSNSLSCIPVESFTLPQPSIHYEDPPQPLDLPICEVKELMEVFTTIKSVKARLESLTTYEHIMNNEGTDVTHGTTKLFIRVFLTPTEQVTLSYPVGYPGDDITRSLDQLSALDFSSFTECHTLPSGTYDLVISPQVTGVLFHEIAHNFEGVLPHMRIPDFISVIDHPRAERLGGYNYDSEGCEASQTVLVSKGIIEHCLTSTTVPGTVPPTGNARASSFDVHPIPRQSNLEVDAHDRTCSEDELMEISHNGVYIAQVGGGSAYPGGIIYFNDLVAYRIENGALSHPVKNILLGGNLEDIIGNIHYMGKDHTVVPSVCWKDNQRLYVTTKAPSSLIKNISLVSHTSKTS